MTNIAIFASGSGTNADNIVCYFKGNPGITVKLIICDIANAGVLEKGRTHGIKTVYVERAQFRDERSVLFVLENEKINFIVLAGFLALVPPGIVKSYSGRILNIHPALLPAYGGKGMYGHRVHSAVIANSETRSGITIHRVNEKYDDGAIIFQAYVDVSPDDTPDSLAEKIHHLEYEHYPRVIEEEIHRESKNI